MVSIFGLLNFVVFTEIAFPNSFPVITRPNQFQWDGFYEWFFVRHFSEVMITGMKLAIGANAAGKAPGNELTLKTLEKQWVSHL